MYASYADGNFCKLAKSNFSSGNGESVRFSASSLSEKGRIASGAAMTKQKNVVVKRLKALLFTGTVRSENI
jgi:hypothetical protein